MENTYSSVSPPCDFIRKSTLPAPVPLCPEIHLYQAADAFGLWQALEDRLGCQIPPPYWAFCWPGGQALTRYLLDTPDLVRGKRVLDFAAGSGMSAIAAALAGARESEVAEIDALALAATSLNAVLNGVSLTSIGGEALGKLDGGWDVVVAGDVCYERPMAEQVFGWLSELARQGVTVLLADPGRMYLPGVGLERLATYTVPTRLDLEDRAFRETSVYRVAGNSCGCS